MSATFLFIANKGRKQKTNKRLLFKDTFYRFNTVRYMKDVARQATESKRSYQLPRYQKYQLTSRMAKVSVMKKSAFTKFWNHKPLDEKNLFFHFCWVFGQGKGRSAAIKSGQVFRKLTFCIPLIRMIQVEQIGEKHTRQCDLQKKFEITQKSYKWHKLGTIKQVTNEPAHFGTMYNPMMFNLIINKIIFKKSIIIKRKYWRISQAALF